METHVEKKGAEAIPLKGDPAKRDSNESLKVFIKTRYQCLNSRWCTVIDKNLLDEIMVHLSKSIFQVCESDDERGLFYSCLIDNGCHH